MKSLPCNFAAFFVNNNVTKMKDNVATLQNVIGNHYVH